MQRRNFLYNSSILASAIIAAPSAVWSAEKYKKTNVLIVYDASANADRIHSIIKESSGLQVKELALDQVSDLVYSSDGFLLTMNDGEQYRSGKIIFSSFEKMDVSRVSVKIKTGNKDVGLKHGAGNHETVPGPEFWAFTSKKFDNGKIKPFLKRKKHAFLCIS